MWHVFWNTSLSGTSKNKGVHIVSDNPAGLINTFKQAIIDGATVEKLYWDNIMSPYPSRESDIIYMLKSLLK